MLPTIEQKQQQQQRFGRENTSLTAPGRLERSSSIISIISLHDQEAFVEENDNHHDDSLFLKVNVSIWCVVFKLLLIENSIFQKISNQESENIVSTYFRPKRVTELMQQSQNFTNWTGKGNLLLF